MYILVDALSLGEILENSLVKRQKMQTLVLFCLVICCVAIVQLSADTGRAASGSSPGSTTPRRTTGPKTTARSKSTSRLRTTTRPRTTNRPYISCYYCGDPGFPCPQPFRASHPNVRRVQSFNGFCEVSRIVIK